MSMSGCLLYVEYKENYCVIYHKFFINNVIRNTFMRTERFRRLPNLARCSWVIVIKFLKKRCKWLCIIKSTTHWAWCAYSITNADNAHWLKHNSHTAHRCSLKFFQGKATSQFCLSFSGCWRCNSIGPSQNALPFLHHKRCHMLQQHSEKLCFVGAAVSIFYSCFFSYSTTLRGLPLSKVTVSLHFMLKMPTFNRHIQ